MGSRDLKLPYNILKRCGLLYGANIPGPVCIIPDPRQYLSIACIYCWAESLP